MHKSLLTAGILALGLAACSQEKTTDTTTSSAPTTTPAAAAPVAPTEAAAGVERAEPVATPATPALATQPGPEGMQAALTKARVIGDILTVELQYSLPPTMDSRIKSSTADIEQVSYIDDATSRKYNVLKDQAGMYMAQPLNYNKQAVSIMARKDGPAIVSFKFPAPPATSTTVSLSVPGTGSFDGIPVQR